MISESLAFTQLSDEEQLRFQTELFTLLANLSSEYTKGRSSSIPESLAKDFMESIIFNLRLTNENRIREIINTGVRENFDFGVRLARKKTALSGRIWKKVFFARPDLFNHSMLTTLTNIRRFPYNYDCKFFAHQTPCEIDYQLCIPVSQGLKGVDYIIQYLRHLLIENEFLNCFDPKNCKPVLDKYCKTWQTEVLNIFEPIAETAIILALIGGDIKSLQIEENELVKIYCMLSNSTQTELAAVLNTAARQVLKTISMKAPAQEAYLFNVAENMAPKFAYLVKSQVDYQR